VVSLSGINLRLGGLCEHSKLDAYNPLTRLPVIVEVGGEVRESVARRLGQKATKMRPPPKGHP